MTIASKLLTIAQNEQEVATQKEAIRQAIIAKNVAVPAETPLSQFPAKIGEISAGVPENAHTVRFIDFDGTVLKEQLVADGGSATAPTQYEMYVVAATKRGETILSEEDWVIAGSQIHEYLIFHSWNNAFDNVTEEFETGAIYTTVDDATYYFVKVGYGRLNTRSVNIQVYNNGGVITVDWGDGTTSTNAELGSRTLNKVYSSLGYYRIKLTTTGSYELSSNYVLGMNTLLSPVLERFYVAQGVTTMATEFLRDTNGLTAISLPPSLINYGAGFLRYRTSLVCVVIPNGVTSVPDYSFFENYRLKRVVLPRTIKSVGKYAFYSCHHLERAYLPDNVTTFGQYAFYACYILKMTRLPSSLTSWGVYTFNGATNVSFSDIPVGITSIPTNCLTTCRAISRLNFPAGVTAISDAGMQSQLALSELNLNEGLEYIGSSWLSNNMGLTRLVIPSTVTYIGQYGLVNFNSLTELIMLPTTPPSIVEPFFTTSGCPILRIFVPDASLSNYQVATNWRNYASWIYPMSELPTE